MPTRTLGDLVRSGIANVNVRSLALAVIVVVVIVWQVPHTIVLRFSLLIGLGLLAWPVAFPALFRPATPAERRARWPFAALAAFLAWSVVVGAVVSPDALQSFIDLRAEWLAPTLILVLGYGLSLRYGEGDAVVRVLFLALVFHAYLQLVSAALVVAQGGAINFLNFGGIGDHKANVTYTNTFAFAMLIADTVARTRGGTGFLRIGTGWALAAFALILGSTVLATTRNGLAVFALMAVIGFALVARALGGRATRRAWAALAVCGALTLAGGIVAMKADPRWSSFMATVPIAWDTGKYRQWLLGEHDEIDLPATATGKPVEPSAYYRIAYLKEATLLLLEHPWGTRIGRDAFRLAMHDKYGVAGMSHAHNGFLDLGVSLGFPGVILWTVFMASFAVYALKGSDAERSGLRAAMVLTIVGFAARTWLDATIRDHVLQEFMLVAGVLTGAIAYGEGVRRGST